VIRLADYQSTVTYSVGSHHGRAIFTVNIARPGKFTISTSGASGTGDDLAIGGSVASAIVGTLVPALPLTILAFVGGLLVFILRIVRSA
jgi:hypothetical protein